MKKLLLIGALALASISSAYAEHSTATLCAEYKYEQPIYTKDSLNYKSDVYLLQIAPNESRFYSLKTEFHDSLQATPGGKELISQLALDALNNSGAIKRDSNGAITSITVSKQDEAWKSVPQRGITFNVYKDSKSGNMVYIDRMAGIGENYGAYTTSMAELEWMPGDSTKIILGFECQDATADYHGRKWHVWYAPEIAVAEGPWQLCGLPGLILSAESENGEYRFTATSIREANEPIKDMPGSPAIEEMDRKSFRRQEAEAITDPAKVYGGMFNAKKQTMHHNLIETYY